MPGSGREKVSLVSLDLVLMSATGFLYDLIHPSPSVLSGQL